MSRFWRWWLPIWLTNVVVLWLNILVLDQGDWLPITTTVVNVALVVWMAKHIWQTRRGRRRTP